MQADAPISGKGEPSEEWIERPDSTAPRWLSRVREEGFSRRMESLDCQCFVNLPDGSVDMLERLSGQAGKGLLQHAFGRS